jgi:hypothetical protein
MVRPGILDYIALNVMMHYEEFRIKRTTSISHFSEETEVNYSHIS